MAEAADGGAGPPFEEFTVVLARSGREVRVAAGGRDVWRLRDKIARR
jgi:hypothetical protein